MYKNLTFFLLFLFGLTSCQPVLKIIYGVKKPKPKTDTQVIQYAQKVFDKEYKMYRPIDSKSYHKLLDLDVNKVPGIIFFDSKGVQKSMHQDTLKSCTAHADSFIQQLDLLEDAPSMGLTKEEVLQHIAKINFKEEKEVSKSTKYSIIILWADWIGPKLNKEKTDDWVSVYHSLDQTVQDDIDLIILNMDLTEDEPM